MNTVKEKSSPPSGLWTLNSDGPQMDVTPARQPQRAPDGVVTWIYNRRRPYGGAA